MPHYVASDLGLHCLPMSHKKDTRLIWVKPIYMPEHSGRVLDSRSRGRGLEPHRRQCVVSLSKTHFS